MDLLLSVLEWFLPGKQKRFISLHVIFDLKLCTFGMCVQMKVYFTICIVYVYTNSYEKQEGS